MVASQIQEELDKQEVQDVINDIFRFKREKCPEFSIIDTNVPTMQKLGLPEVLGDFAMEKNGLVIIIGATGSGKSTTLAAMIDKRNSESESHIITLEDPIEFVHDHKKSLVAQREVGTDVDDFEDGIIAAMREAPDVILLGEIQPGNNGLRHEIRQHRSPCLINITCQRCSICDGQNYWFLPQGSPGAGMRAHCRKPAGCCSPAPDTYS